MGFCFIFRTATPALAFAADPKKLEQVFIDVYPSGRETHPLSAVG
jgi:hypothetical protein